MDANYMGCGKKYFPRITITFIACVPHRLVGAVCNRGLPTANRYYVTRKNNDERRNSIALWKRFPKCDRPSLSLFLSFSLSLCLSLSLFLSLNLFESHLRDASRVALVHDPVN